MWHNQRLGLIMIVASLLVMALVVSLTFSDQLNTRQQQIRSQGVGLAKVLSGMEWAELVPERGRQGILQALRQGQNNPDFAYAAVIDVHGTAATDIAAPGVVIPNRPVPNDPTNWLGERLIDSESGDVSFLEFHAPVFNGSDLQGYVRLGYFQPHLAMYYDDIPFFSALTLPVFLLMPLFYFLLRREIQPLRAMNENIEDLLEGNTAQRVELHPSGELGEFIQRFNNVVASAQQRIHSLEDEQNGLLTSNKMLTYRQTRIESILRTLPDAVLVIDEAGTVSYANEKIFNLLGKTPESVIGKKPQEWCDDPNIITYLTCHSANSGQVGYISDCIRVASPLDTEKMIEVKAYPLFSPKNGSQLFGSMAVIRDCTEEQRNAQNRGEFIAQVSHELKTPLNVLAMYSEAMLGEDGKSESFRIEAINVIHDEVERLSNLINNMLAINKFELGGINMNRQFVRVGELLQDAFTNISQSGRGKDLEFKINLPHEMKAINVDKELLRIAVNNLLTNAIKYNKPEGVVTLEALESDDALEISVSDTGVGINTDDQRKIFDKFYRANDDQVRQQTGHGLGLSLVQQIVQSHHGKLSVKSEYGKGSTFTIRLEKEMTTQPQAGVV